MKHIELKDHYTRIMETIDNSPLDDFISFAKQYDLSVIRPEGTFYNYICTKIKERLDREGLSHDIIRPE